MSTPITSAEYQDLDLRVKTLKASLEQVKSDRDNTLTLLSTKLETSTFKKYSTLIEQQINAFSVQLNTFTAIALDPIVTSIGTLSSSGFLVVDPTNDLVYSRTFAGTTNRISVTNSNGISGNPTIDIASTYTGQSSITTLGVVTNGTWNGNLIGITYGGTGANTANAALNNLLPSQAGNANKVLLTDGSNVSWYDASSLGYTNEQAQDAIAAALTNSSTVNFSYNDTLNQITAVVNQANLVLSQSQITNLVSDLANKASLVHTHLNADITDFSTGVDARITLQKGAANGLATLDGSSKIPSSQLPSYVDDVLEYANFSSLPVTGSTGLIYITLDNNKTYRWSGSIYIEISPSEVISVNSLTGIVTLTTSNISEGSNQYFTDERAQDAIGSILQDSSTVDFTYDDLNGTITASVIQAALTLSQSQVTNLITDLSGKQPLNSNLTTISGLSPSDNDILQRKAGAWTNRTMAQLKSDLTLIKSDVGLANVDNTSDINKPVSTAQQSAIDAKVADAINDGTTTIAPSQNAVFDALASKQNLDATLTALASFNSNGILTQTAADTFTSRTITGTASRVLVSNGNGVSGNPTLDIDSAYDTFVLNRSNHTGTQLSSTISDLTSTINATNARIAVNKNSGATVGTRRRLNLIEGTNVTITVADDNANEEIDITIASTGGGGISDGDKGDITVSGSGSTWTIDNQVITDAKLRDSAATSVIGRAAGSSGSVADITASADNQVLVRTSGSLTFGTITSASVSDFNEAVQDAAFNAVVAGDGIDLNYNDAANTLTITNKIKVGQVTIDFGAIEDTSLVHTVSAPWITSSTILMANMAYESTTDHDPDDIMWDQVTVAPGQIINATSFQLALTAPEGTWGKYKVNYIAYL